MHSNYRATRDCLLYTSCVEWRADWFEGFQSPAAIARCVQKLRVALRDKLCLLYTSKRFRKFLKRFSKSATTYFHKPFPANYLRHK